MIFEPAFDTLDTDAMRALQGQRLRALVATVQQRVSMYRERLAATGAVDIPNLQQATPNLTVQVARGSNSTLLSFIRGVGQQDPLWGFEPGVGLYIDDVYVARPQAAVLDIFDVQRLEVDLGAHCGGSGGRGAAPGRR